MGGCFAGIRIWPITCYKTPRGRYWTRVNARSAAMMAWVLSMPSRFFMASISAMACPVKLTDSRFPPDSSNARFDSACRILSGVRFDGGNSSTLDRTLFFFKVCRMGY